MMVGFYSALNPEGRNIMMNITSSSVSWTNFCVRVWLWSAALVVWSQNASASNQQLTGLNMLNMPGQGQWFHRLCRSTLPHQAKRAVTASELQSQIMAKELGHKQKPQSWASRRIPGPPGDLLGGHLTSGSDATKNIDILNNPSPCLSNCCVSDWSK